MRAAVKLFSPLCFIFFYLHVQYFSKFIDRFADIRRHRLAAQDLSRQTEVGDRHEHLLAFAMMVARARYLKPQLHIPFCLERAHKLGKRHENEPENLELLIGAHFAGVRVRDFYARDLERLALENWKFKQELQELRQQLEIRR